MNIWDILILAAVGFAVAAGIRQMRKSKKSGCSCGCAGCTQSCSARKREKK